MLPKSKFLSIPLAVILGFVVLEAAFAMQAAGGFQSTPESERAQQAVNSGRGGATGPAAQAAEVDYRIGEDDELEISVYGDPALIKTQAVRPGGKIAFPLVGEIKASGLTPSELREQLTERLAAYLTNPSVTVIVTKYNSRKVSILGEVKTPGLLNMSSDITLLEGISRAGGITADAELTGAQVIRNRQVLPIDLERLLRQGDISQDVVLKPNDVILIPSVKDRNVSVLGQVRKPLVLPLRSGTTLIEAISRAEGITEDADLTASVLMRGGQVESVDFEKLLRHGDASQNVILKPNDVVLIPDVRDKKVFVLGAVNKPMVVSLKLGLTVVESIAVAGGFAEGAQPRSVVLVRGGLANPTLSTLNLKEVTDRAEMSQNAMLQPNDIVFVPKSFVYNLNQFFRSISTVITPIILARAGLTIGADLQQIANPGQNAGPKPVVVVP